MGTLVIGFLKGVGIVIVLAVLTSLLVKQCTGNDQQDADFIQRQAPVFTPRKQ